MKKQKNNPNDADAFFETIIEDTKKAAKEEKKKPIKEAITGEYHNKNIIYKYKDGAHCTLVLNPKDSTYITRQMY